MANENPFSAHIVPEGAGASFAASRGGGFAIVIPLTLRAEHWLLDNLTAEASWQGDSLVVELSHFPALADAIIEAGFTFERDPLPN